MTGVDPRLQRHPLARRRSSRGVNLHVVQFVETNVGLFVVHYETPKDMLPAAQSDLVAAVEAAAFAVPVGLVFIVSDAVRTVDMSVPTFWLQLTAREELRLRAFAIVTNSSAVRVAASGFGLANRIRKLKLEVQVFKTQQDAVAWVQAVLHGDVRS